MGFIDLKLAGIRVAKALLLPLAPEARETRSPGEEVPVGALQVLQGVLQRMNGSVFEPRGLLTATPLGQQLRHRYIGYVATRRVYTATFTCG
jgi:hypothetical protein